MNDDTTGCLAVLIVIFVILWLWSPVDFFSSQITTYTAICVPKTSQADKCEHLQTGARITYKLNEDRADAVYWIIERPDLAPRPLKDCVIRDTNNWTCNFADGLSRITVLDGIPARHAIEKRASQVYVRKYQWWLARAWKWLTGEYIGLGHLIPEQREDPDY